MDYAHARHAGNAGDVLKHVALIAAVEAVKPAVYVETHAGDGFFPLGSNGEWSEGIQKLWGVPGTPSQSLVGRYLDLVRSSSPPGASRPAAYPGSPLIVRNLLPPARLVLHEVDAQAATVLRRTVPDADVRAADGFGFSGSADLILVDPPYTQKQEWTDAARFAASRTGTPLLLWYPIKALTRPRALLSELAKLGVHGTAVELHWTPLRLKRERLNGSGVIFTREVPRAAVAALCAALTDLGPALQTHGEWNSALIGF